MFEVAVAETRPSVMVVANQREYGPVPLDGVGEVGLAVIDVAVMGDAELKAVLEQHFDMAPGTLASHEVVRPASGMIVVSPRAEMGDSVYCEDCRTDSLVDESGRLVCCGVEAERAERKHRERERQRARYLKAREDEADGEEEEA